MFVVQDSSCSDGGSGTPLSDKASLTCLDLQNMDSSDQDQDQEQHPQEVQAGCVKDKWEVESSLNQSGSVAENQQKVLMCF